MDRNYNHAGKLFNLLKSLSARRAWIEIRGYSQCPYWHIVALRKESVDRNDNGNAVAVSDLVALRKESVDRNRSTHRTSEYVCASLSARRAWIEMTQCRL